jgi:mannose-6-phosphate isomerase
VLYPLKFKPVFRDKIWGGQRLRTSLGLDFSPLTRCGEAWMLSGVEGSQTVVANGFLAGNELNEVLEVYMDELVGEKVFEKFGHEFPILVKFIDAADYLSVQVHPDDELAAARGLNGGKTEMWYILDAEPGAELITGFNRKMDEALFRQYMEEKRLREILNVEKAARGDVFYIPAGRVHALGPGILLAEIQQTSDTTYRIYDWDRVGPDGQPREMHTELAVGAIDFSPAETYRTQYPAKENDSAALVECPSFNTSLLEYNRPATLDYADLDSFVIYLCTGGGGTVTAGGEAVSLSKGEVLLLPATTEEVTLQPDPNITILAVSVP